MIKDDYFDEVDFVDDEIVLGEQTVSIAVRIHSPVITTYSDAPTCFPTFIPINSTKQQ
jgi:hypothetical protein